MKPNLFPIFIFCTVFLFVVNRHVFSTVLSGFGKPKLAYSKIENTDLSDYIKKQTGVEITSFYLVDSPKLFATMTGIPTKPVMTFSKSMYKSFSPEELRYVLLHETGHYVNMHTFKEILIQVAMIALALVIFYLIKSPTPLTSVFALIFAVLLGVAAIQVMRRFEWQADTYALKHLDNPQVMIDATKKLEAAWGGSTNDSMVRKLFNRAIPYNQRIEFAKNFSKLETNE